MRRPILPALLAAAGFAVGCAGGGYYYDGTAVVTGYYAPDLVYVNDGVYAVAGFDYPVFYANNAYWRYHRGSWYRSPYYDRGWVYARPPRAVARIDRPWRYRSYRPQHYEVRRQHGRTYYYPRYDRRHGRVIIRDHRRRY